MKGGSATKILLETACVVGVLSAMGGCSIDDDAGLARLIRSSYAQYEAAVRRVYDQSRDIGALIDLAAKSLTTPVAFPSSAATFGAANFVVPTGRGRILYIGVGTSALLGVIDASECYPTYGSR